MKKTKIGFLSVAFMYVGTLMGAGFASGREIWQFLGVFGKSGYLGTAIVAFMFVTIGFMTSRLARIMDSNDVGKIIVPGDNNFIKDIVAYFLSIALFLGIIVMSAAGGALFYQQFGLSRVLGGAIVVILVSISVIGGFERVLNIFRFVMPVLMVTVIIVCLVVIINNAGEPHAIGVFKPSPLAPNWWLAALLFFSFNAIGIVPIVATASIHAKNEKHAYFGSILGGILLSILVLAILITLLTDMEFTAGKDMPMLAFSEQLSPAVNLVYIAALSCAIYVSATSTFYGFTIKMITGSHRKLKIIVAAWIGFALGLIGFTRIVEYVFPLEGFFDVAIIIMLITNYFKTTRKIKGGRSR